jgi:DNA-binding NarL/FixJ family response regulator
VKPAALAFEQDGESETRLRRPVAPYVSGAVVCDATPVYRAGLRQLAREAGVAAVTEVGTLNEARAAIEETKPGLVVFDGGMVEQPEALLRSVRRVVPRVRVLVLARHDDVDVAREFLAAGLDGYVPRDDPPHALLAAIRDVLVGVRHVSARLPPSLAEEGMRGILVPSLARLSRRERELLDLFVRGFSNDHVARELRVSVKTVQTHRARINRKLCVHSAAELVRFAALRGLVRP